MNDYTHPLIPRKTQPQRVTTPAKPPVEIVRITISEPDEVEANGLLAMVDLRIGGLLLRDLRVHRRRHNTIYIDPPAKRVGKRWLPYSEFVSEALANEVRRIVLAAVSSETTP